MRRKRNTFSDYKQEGHLWITLATGEYYPDILPLACDLYKPVLVHFEQLLKSAYSSNNLLKLISEIPNSWMRVQLSRVFRKYISPETPVEMLKKKTAVESICDKFGKGFRPIGEAQLKFSQRPLPDEALCALLWEYKDRGKKGYDLTENFFGILRENFPSLIIEGPERAGKDIRLGDIFPGYPKKDRPVDFIIRGKGRILAVGLARYDSDRGGAQEDDRPGQYRDCAREIISFSNKNRLKTKVIFINDGPGLLLGSMWDDYASLETSFLGRVLVATLRMVPKRITLAWLHS